MNQPVQSPSWETAELVMWVQAVDHSTTANREEQEETAFKHHQPINDSFVAYRPLRKHQPINDGFVAYGEILRGNHQPINNGFIAYGDPKEGSCSCMKCHVPGIAPYLAPVLSSQGTTVAHPTELSKSR